MLLRACLTLIFHTCVNLAYGGLLVVRLGRWALLLLLPASSNQPSSDLAGKGEGIGRQGGGGAEEAGAGRRVTAASDENLAVTLAVSVAAAAVCYTLAGASLVRRAIGCRLVSSSSLFAASTLQAADNLETNERG